MDVDFQSHRPDNLKHKGKWPMEAITEITDLHFSKRTQFK